MKASRLIVFAVALAMGSGIEIARGDVLGTAFTYQAQLKDGGSPANGDYDFVFRLFDDPNNGAQIGSDFPVDDWPVTDGLFTVEVDFGAGVFTSDARWLEIDVRDSAGGSEYTTLSPRQALTPTPYASTALQTVGVDGHSLDAADGSPTDAVLVDSDGRVRMEEGGLVVFDAVGQGIWLVSDNFQFAEGTSEDPVYDFSSTTGTHRFWTIGARRMVITADGGVGIGTDNPGSRLHVRTTAGGTAIQAESNGSGYQCAVDAFVESPEGNAIFAFNEGWTGNAYAIVGDTASPSGTAIYGWASNSDLWDSANIGVHGRADGDNNAVGVYGEATNPNPDGTTYGVRGVSDEGTGVRGDNQYTGNYGTLGSQFDGVRGIASGGGAGVVGIAGGWGPAGSFVISDDTNTQPAVKGRTDNPDGYAGYFIGGRNYFEGSVGIWVQDPEASLDVLNYDGLPAIRGVSSGVGVYGLKNSSTGTFPGVWGATESLSSNATGVRGFVNSTAPGAYSAGVRGHNNGTGSLGIGVWGSQDGGGWGVYGDAPDGTGVYGNSANGIGVRGDSSNGYAGYFTGTVRVSVLEIVGADVAEKFPVSDDATHARPGTVMEIDPENPGKLRVARGAYNRRVAGVVSGAGDIPVGTILGNLPGSEDAPAIALSGRVWVKCDATETAIELGDLLTTSNTPGHAMAVSDFSRAHGTVIGKAMTGLEEGTGLVLVLVNLQ